MIQAAFSISKKSPVTRYRCPTFQNIVSKIKKKRLISSLDMNRIIFVIDIWLFINIVVHNCEIYTNLETYLTFLLFYFDNLYFIIHRIILNCDFKVHERIKDLHIMNINFLKI